MNNKLKTKKMKKSLICVALIATSLTTFAQVGVGTTSPNGALDIVSTNSGLVVPRVTNTAAVTNPQGGAVLNGTIVYDISANCLKAYENDAWTECLSAAGTNAAIVNDNCDQNGFEGAYIGGVALGGSNDFTVTITNNSFSSASIALNTSDLVFSGSAAGSVTVASVSPTSVSLTAGQSQLITYQLSGTPDTGTLQADWTKISLSCTRTRSVGNGDATFVLPVNATIVSINDGSPLVDIQGIADNASNQFVVNVAYTAGAGSYSSYTSAEGGDANGFSISYPAGVFSASGTLPVTITVDGDGSFNAEKQLFGVLKTIASMDFQVEGVSKGNIVLDVVGGVPDRNFADADHKFVYLPVTNVDGKVWLNNNLGANYANLNHANFSPTTQATSSTDVNAYGSSIQWGRYSDGHELASTSPVSGTSSTSTVASPNTTRFLFGNSNWYTGASPDNLWQDEAGTNNVCPQGYRVPTEAEWDSVRLTNNAGVTVATNNWGTATDHGINGTVGALASTLKLPLAGYRIPGDGQLSNVGSSGHYWSSTVSGTSARNLGISSSGAIVNTNIRAFGFSVRCLKE